MWIVPFRFLKSICVILVSNKWLDTAYGVYMCVWRCQQFMQDCSDVMQLLLKTQTEMQDMPEDDPQVCKQSTAVLLCPLLLFIVYDI